MKIDSIDIKPEGSDAITLTFRDPTRSNPFNIIGVTGLDAEGISPQYYTGSILNTRFYNLSMADREIVAQIGLNPNFTENQTYSDLRDILYKAIASDRTGYCTLWFKNGSTTVATIACYISKFDTSQFSQSQEVTITFYCENAMFIGDTSVDVPDFISDPTYNTVIDTITGSDLYDPFAVAMLPSGGDVYVGGTSGLTPLCEVDTSSNLILGAISTHACSLVVTPDGNWLYIGSDDGNVYVLNTTTHTIVETIPMGGTTLYGIASTPDSANIYVTNQLLNIVQVIQVSSNTIVATITDSSFNNPYNIAINPAGTRVYVTNQESDPYSAVSVIDTSSNTVIAAPTNAPYITYYALTVSGDGSVVYICYEDGIDQLNTSTNTITGFSSVSGSGIYGIIQTPDLLHLYVTDFTTDTVSVIKCSDGSLVATIPVGVNPAGLAITPDGNYIYVANSTGPSISVIKAMHPPTSVDLSDLTVTDDVSTAPHGLQFELAITADISSLIISDNLSDPSWTFELDFDFLTGDTLHFSNIQDDIYLFYVREGVQYQLADKIATGSTMPIIFPGVNSFQFSNSTDISMTTFLYYPTFWGV